MNAGFSSLTQLKQQLLAEALRAGTKYDAALLALGLGVAAQFERFTNRKFLRTQGAQFVCTADRDHVYVDRYPLESISAVDFRSSSAVGWEAQTDFVWNINESTGHVYWGSAFHDHYAQIRFTFTGGYWWDITEESNDTLPAGATALPDDLKYAWLLQCRELWANQDKRGVNIVQAATDQFSVAAVELAPVVLTTLNQYRRFQLT
jgi:hypothetical protein